MNLPNKITLGRIILSVIVLILMVFPFYEVGVTFPEYLIAGKVTISLKYIICGVLFIIASVTDFLDGNIARTNSAFFRSGNHLNTIYCCISSNNYNWYYYRNYSITCKSN